MSLRARFNRFAAGALVQLWLVGLIIMAVGYVSGADTEWTLLVVVLNAPLVWKFLQHAIGEGSALHVRPGGRGANRCRGFFFGRIPGLNLLPGHPHPTAP